MSDTLIAALITAIATILAALIGIYIKYGSFANRMTEWNVPKRLDKRRLSWHDIHLGILTLYKLIRQNYTPDLVVGVSRGGSLIAGAVAKRLDCDLVVFRFREEQREENGVRRIRLKSLEQLDLCGKRVLLVSDAMRTGQLVASAVEVLKQKLPLELRTAILIWTIREHSTLQERGTIFKPDYCAYITNRVDYEFPWTFD